MLGIYFTRSQGKSKGQASNWNMGHTPTSCEVVAMDPKPPASQAFNVPGAERSADSLNESAWLLVVV